MVKQDLSYYKVDRNKFLLEKSIDKRLSSNFLQYDYPNEKYYKKGIEFIIKSFYNLFKFVTNETVPNLSIDINSNESFCNLSNNKIQLGTKLLANKKFTQSEKVDVLFAIMLHEMFHKRYTAPFFKPNLASLYPPDPVVYPSDVTDIRMRAKELKLKQTIFNILEDYRIEKLGMKDFPGYVFYFDFLRKYALYLHYDKEFNPLFIKNVGLEFLMIYILLPELTENFLQRFNDFQTIEEISKKTIHNEINNIKKVVDDNKNLVYSDSIEDLLIAVDKIFDVIEISCVDLDYKECFQEFSFIRSEDDLEELPDRLGQEMSDMINTCIEYEESLIEGGSEAKSRNEKIITGNRNDGLYNTVTIFNPKAVKVNDEILLAAQKISKNLSQKLDFLSSKLITKTFSYGSEEGDLDEDELYSIKYSNNIFLEEEKDKKNEFDLGILIDQSGSMEGNNKLKEAMIATLAIMLAFKNRNDINLFIYGHNTSVTPDSIDMYEYYNNKRKIKDWKSIFSISAEMSNADGFAIGKIGDIMMKDSYNKEKILIVISDGMPNASKYQGEKAKEHVKSTVNDLENKGFKIIQICIDNIEESHKMFNNFIPYNNGEFTTELQKFLIKKITTKCQSF